MATSFSHVDLWFYDQLTQILECSVRPNRTGVDTYDSFGFHAEFRMSEGFPILSLKRTHWKSVVEELAWFLRGETNVRSLQEKGVTIWDEWADENGDVGPVYGKQWRRWEPGGNGRIIGHETDIPPIDQLLIAENTIKNNPDSRRNIISAWNVSEIHRMALPPCHVLSQFYVETDGSLSLHLYQRSADLFLGVPFNIASYSLLLHLMASRTGRKANRFIYSGGSLHLYTNHVEQAKEVISRAYNAIASMEEYFPPTLLLSERVKQMSDLRDLQLGDCMLVDYNPWPAIKADVAV